MTVFVTGASGFVGAHLVAELAAAALGPIVAADLDLPPPEAPTIFPIERISLDVTDRDAVLTAIDAARPTFVVHAAAITPSLDEEAAEMGRIAAVNVVGAANVIEAAKRSGSVRRLVVFSSSAVYNGMAAYPDLLSEDGPLPATPASLYAVTKLACEGMVHRAIAGGLSACALRVASVYGERERATDSRKAARLSLMHRLARATAENRQVRIAGARVGRDWVHGDDVGAAVVRLLASDSIRHGVYNVASGSAVPFGEIVAHFVQQGLRVTDAEDAPLIGMMESEHRPPLAIGRLVADVGYAPRVSLAHGIRTLVAFHREAAR